MRLSVDKTDRAYSTSRDGYRARVTLDGETQTGCITADEEEGMVVRFARDPDGKMVVVGGMAVTEIVFGHVTITIQRLN